jgi:hypothetical protein
VKQIADGRFKLWRNLLRLVRHVKLGQVVHLLVVGLDQSRDESDERRLPRAVLAEQHDNLGVGEVASLHGEFEVALGLGHARVSEPKKLGFTREDVIRDFLGSKRQRVVAEAVNKTRCQSNRPYES